MKAIKFLALLLTMAMLAACSGTSAAESGTQHAVKGDYPPKVDIFIQSAFRSYDSATRQITVEEDAYNEWIDYMNSIYPFDITVDGSGNVTSFYDSINLGQQTGIACLPPQHILSLIQGGKIEPLDEYLANNKAWMSLPEKYRKTFEYNGHIWAIANSDNQEPQVLSIRTDWLNKVGLGMPASTAELLEAARAFMAKDANGNGKKDDYLLGGYTSSMFGGILQAFGIYEDSNRNVMAYDPDEKSIMDSMFKPQAKEALTFLRTLIDEGLVDPLSFSDGKTAFNNSYNGEYALIYTSIAGGKYSAGISWTKNHAQDALGHEYDPNSDSDYRYATSLFEAMPPLSDYSMPYYSYCWGYVLAGGTAQPKQTVNAFVDMLFTSKQSYLDCVYGIPERYTLTPDNVLMIRYKDAETKTPYPAPRIANLSDIMLGKDVYVTYDAEDQVDVALGKTRKVEYTAYDQDYKDKYSDKLKAVPPFYVLSGTTYMDKSAYLSSQYYKLLNGLNNEYSTVDQMLYDYQQYIILWSGQDVLNESNQALGLKCKQTLK